MLQLVAIAAAGATNAGIDQRASLQNGTAFDFYFFALSWPPSAVPIEAHGRARHIMHQGEANAGFWTHGLWPQK